jgi:hypothetical protein
MGSDKRRRRRKKKKYENAFFNVTLHSSTILQLLHCLAA